MKRTLSQRRGISKLASGRKNRKKRVHVHLVSLFGVAAFFLVLLNVAIILTPSHQAEATAADTIAGWAWSDTGGWLSMNNINAGAGGSGSYGVNLDINTKAVTGFAWSDDSGWVCFGSSCAAAACANGANAPSGVAPTASVDVSNRLRGWAMFCNLGATNGWISLNCNDTSPVSCGTSNYGPTINFGTGAMSGFAWHGAGPGIGWGWIDFSAVNLTSGFEGTLVTCHDSLDNDADGGLDCADNLCIHQVAYQCPAAETQCAWIGQSNCCGNGVDDDLDGLTDCADTTDCSADSACIPEICNNGIDDGDTDSLIDCADPECFTFPACTPPWLQTQNSNIYAQQGVTGNAPPAGFNNATYCIASGGTITNFVSQQGCIESTSQTLNLPSNGNGFVSNIGRLDVNGILAGRYGTVVPIANDAALPTALAGKVYLYDKDAQGGACPSGTNFNLAAKTFQNASGSAGRGNGLLVIKGCDLNITGDIAYQATGVSQYIRNLASFGVVVLTKYVSGVAVSGGNIYVNSSVANLGGLYFGEKSIHTGSTGGTFTDVQLNVAGAFVSKDIKLERRYGSPTGAAENVTFDGRAVANPPPGLQDVTKSLPSLKDTY